ncbi:MAG: CHAD domain-containing protein [Bacteroidales bacterium]|nr:CHAD domain-containing protein [Bacteroidales bacterium]
MKNEISAYYLLQKDIFEENFRLVIDQFDQEAIHKMRTTTKRLRALFLLIGFLTEEKFKPKNQLKKIRSLFKLAGKIRELQIEQGLVQTYNSENNKESGAYTEYLRTREYREISRFLKHLPEIAKRKRILKDNKILAAIESIDEKTVHAQCRLFIRNKLNEANEIIHKPKSNHRIHSVRTIVKQLYYLAEIESFKPLFEKESGKDPEKFRETEQLIGNWHDLVNSAIYFESFMKRQKLREDSELMNFRLNIKQKRKALRSDIIKNHLPEFDLNKQG